MHINAAIKMAKKSKGYKAKPKNGQAPLVIPTIIIHSPSASSTSLNSCTDLLTFHQLHICDRDAESVNQFDNNESENNKVQNNQVQPKVNLWLDNLDYLQVKSFNGVPLGLRDRGCVSSDSETSDDETCPPYRTPLKNHRRKSVSAPVKMLKPNDGSRSNSPANSITSINSLASLLREKMQMFPGVFKKKKPKDYKIRACVTFLFLTIVFLITLAYVLYNQKVLQGAYFEKVKFNKADRIVKIYNADGVEVLKGYLGTSLNYNKVFPCLPKDERRDGSICLEWMNRARLYIHYNDLNPEVRCYSMRWSALSEGVALTDCYDLSSGMQHWYGGGQSAESAWPIEKGLHDFAPFVTGRVDRHEWGNVIKRFFINSKGASLLIYDDVPLHTAITGKDNGRQLCLRAKYDDFAFVNRLQPFPHLNYSICTSSNMTRLHSLLTEKSLWDGLKKEEINIIYSLLTEPLWEITTPSKSEFTESAVANYTDDVIALGFLKQGHVLINEFWQKQIGDFTVDQTRFPTLEETINIMHRRGFRIVFAIQPYISTESENFVHAIQKRLLISERFSDRRIPALTRYKSLESAGVLDITNNRTLPWLLDKLKTASNKYKFDAFYLDLGISYNMPHYYQCERPLINPDHYKSLFINSIQSSVPLFGVDSAIERPRAPAFVSLPQFESSWDGLQRVIPTILTYGLIGYPFLIPGAVGGDYEMSRWWSATNSTTDEDILLPDKELYMRWLQLATFLPVIRFTHLPSKYGDDKVLEMARVLTLLRQQTVTPYLKKYANEALDSGLPLIRPLWMVEPNDPACHVVADEFCIGEELIVAPVMYSGARQREVYLPAGVWKDGIDGSYRKGNRWIHDYNVEEDQVAYFEKMPDNTRL